MNDHSDERQQQLLNWLVDIYSGQNITLAAVSGDASFRRYFRFPISDTSMIAVDAPPALENSQPFVDVTQLLLKNKLPVPEIYHASMEHGFFVIQDFGDQLLLNSLNNDSADHLYKIATSALLKIQKINPQSLPPYDSELLQREMALFSDWYLAKHLGISIDDATLKILTETYALLENNALEQPRVFVHRDFHSRNLMILDPDTLGIIDFQDAVNGPITYDLVSLFRDCYIAWPQEKIDQWITEYYLHLPKPREFSEQQFRRWFDLMGMQRHLKATGIFCRLNYRDDKAAYIDDIPRTLNYVMQISGRYEELKPIRLFLENVN